MAKHGYVETSGLAAIYGGGHIYSVRAYANVDNGALVKLEGTEAGSNEIRTGKNPAATDKVCLVASVLMGNGESSSESAETNLFNAKDSIMRVFDLVEGDRFAVSKEMIAGEPKVGEHLITGDNGKYKAQAVAAPSGFSAVVTGIEVKSQYTLVRVRVVKNASA